MVKNYKHLPVFNTVVKGDPLEICQDAWQERTSVMGYHLVMKLARKFSHLIQCIITIEGAAVVRWLTATSFVKLVCCGRASAAVSFYQRQRVHLTLCHPRIVESVGAVVTPLLLSPIDVARKGVWPTVM